MTAVITRHRIATAALVAATALAAVPAAARADGAPPLTDEQAYELTCGHLGVPCAPAHPRAHRRGRSARVRATSRPPARRVTRARSADR
jgi:hypothetical protein